MTDQFAAYSSVSEPGGEDFSANTSTAGRVAVGGSATGEIGSSGDRDWYAVELVAGVEYRIDLEGGETGVGTLADPLLRWLHDSGGAGIRGTRNDDGGQGDNARQEFTPTESGTYYISANGKGSGTGTYRLSVTQVSPPAQEAPAFAEPSYAFALAENADGSTARVSLGTVAATGPEGAALSYSLEGGNGSGLFEIDSGSGELFYVGAGEDFEAGTSPFELTVRASDGDRFTDTTVTVGVSDVQEAPAVRVADAEATEGDDAVIVFRVTLDGASTSAVRVNYATADGTATAGDDYEAVQGTLTFAPGETEKTVSVTVIDDNVEDSGETFRLLLSSPDGATLADSEATGTLLNIESRDDFPAGTGTTGTVEVGGSATGEIATGDDEDWFAVTLDAGKTYRIDLKGSPTGDGTLRDPYLRGVHDADGNLLAGTTDDDGGAGVNSRVYFTAGADATYYVAAGADRDGEGTYTLSVTDVADLPDDFPAGTGTTGTVEVGGSATGEIDYARDRDWFAVTLDAGKTYQIDLKGSSTGDGTLYDPYLRGVHDADGDLLAGTTDDEGGVGVNSRVHFTAGADATYYVAAGAHRDGEGTYTLSVMEVPDDFLAGTGTTGTVAVGGSATGEIDYANDRDWFAVTLVAGKTYRIDLEGSPTGDGTLSDPYLHGVHDADGDLLAGTTDDDGGAGVNSRVHFTAGADATYYVAAGAYEDREGTYTLSVTEVTDDFLAGTGTTRHGGGGRLGHGRDRLRERPGLVRGDPGGRQDLPYRPEGLADRRRHLAGPVSARGPRCGR